MTPSIELAYLLSAVLFVLGLKRMQTPPTARSGNALAALGMLTAVVATLFVHDVLSWPLLLAGVLTGGAIGTLLATRTPMTSMPELVAVFNGFGGAASAFVASAEIAQYLQGSRLVEASSYTPTLAVVIGVSLLVGMVTFTGSLVAFGKLQGLLSGNPITFPGVAFVTGLLLLAGVVGVALLAWGAPILTTDPTLTLYAGIGVAVSAALVGLFLVFPIGGADMPVVVALLNSYSGLAAAATGFILDNTALIVSGTLVGAAGFMLTMQMCDAMNRSLFNVMVGGFGGDGATTSELDIPEGKSVQETSPQDLAILATYAERVIIVPGYGLAVAQAQHAVRELADRLQSKGVDVRYAIHPVAGRMPGHMNVLLAEADVPYEQLFEMDEINSAFSSTDVAIVIGANDVVNPAAREASGSPIAGMPILNVDEAETVVVIKRSLSPGYSGVPNSLFYQDNTRMLFADAKEAVSETTEAVKGL
ncbi:MAG: NAD(P)(+) transhydrogenase (Re/Si-specific) subunit beta [Longimonas sp.]|uniref:NAD(P)(+) transhydrogenase (Re/Si-specific) subunit beta n=1 Tax=Longimonas sp. TaxID=2039626 RepID=UPI003974F04A